MNEHPRRSRLWLILGGIFLALLLAGVFTLGSITTPLTFGTWDQVVILYALSTFMVVALLVFGLMLARTFIRLWAEHHAQQLGSRFKTKMVLGAMAVSLLPLVFMFFISYALMNRTLNRWFPARLEGANTETQMLLLEITRQEHSRLADSAYQAIRSASQAAPGQILPSAARLARERGADQVWTVDANGRSTLAAQPVHLDPSSTLARGMPAGAEFWALSSDFYLTARTHLSEGDLIVGHRLPADFLNRYREIQSQISAFHAEWSQIGTFKNQILLTLSLFTMLLLFAATWMALHLARGVTVPIQALAEATREVGTGNFATQVQVAARDELGTLVRAFNKMTLQLAANRRQIEEFTGSLQHAVQEIDQRRTLIETVLENIPTAVLSLDAAGRIVRANRAARHLFGDRAFDADSTLRRLVGEPAARDIEHLMRRSSRLGGASKELDFRLSGRVVQAAVTLSPLGPRRSGAGYVLVVDDLTELLRAQKAAAWQEVAQRVAHEIKNPLTPIQLSVERLLRYQSRGNASDSPELVKLVAECTTLIAREVGTLKTLVSEFSQFARFPVARLAPADPNNIVQKALDIFQGRLDELTLHTDLAGGLPLVKADNELLRQVIVNLIDNAAEAMEGAAFRHLQIATRFRADHDTVEIVVADSGHGISPEDKEKLFLPYFSTKDRGTGLGLAIAARIIAEHHGLMRAEDNIPVGTRFVIELPAVETAALAQEA